MAFKTYKEIGEVVQAFDLRYEKVDFLPNILVETPLHLIEEIKFTTTKLPYKISEAAIGEMILFPMLRAAWKSFSDDLMLWSHKSLYHHKKLAGIPDYLIAKQSAQGIVVLEKPLLAVVEAKKDDFSGGWAQCAFEMVTMQEINENPQLPVFGIVTNGDVWEFAQLLDKTFTQSEHFTALFPVENLFEKLYALLTLCKQNI